ncbi:MAG: 50S ribosomal protein L6 [Clostridia bacterium]|nr:50S ribosomal protein L6 [Clostridia bacterium]MBR6009011.1 50S ribosomal protein L6 [Clostridia bacterium]
MSRIGKLPVKLPQGVDVKVENNVVTVKGPKGTLTQKVNDQMGIKIENGELLVSRPNDEKEFRAMHGLYRALIHNMVTGVTTGFTKNLELVGVGYRAQADNPSQLTINIGFSHPVVVKAPEHVTFATPNPNKISVSGIDKQVVGEIAAEIRAIRKPEPYHGKGIRYEGEYVRHKEGKSGKK